MAKKGMLSGGAGAVSLNDLESGKMTAPEINKVAEPKVEEPVVKPPELDTEPQIKEVAPEPTQQVKAPVEPVTKPQEPAKVEAKTPQEQIQTSGLNLEFLNTLTGKKFESEDQVKDALTKPTKEAEYEELKSQYDDLEVKMGLLSEQMDPSKYFRDDNALKLAIFERDNPKKDVGIAQKIFATDDLDAVSDLDIVKMGYKFKAPNIKGDIEAAIAEDLNVDPETPFNEWPTSTQDRLAMKASDFRDQFETIKKSVTLPERPNIDELLSQKKQSAEAAKASLTEAWTKNSEEVLKSTNKLKVPVGEAKEGEEQQFFEWDLGEVPKAEIEGLTRDYISLGMPADESNMKSFNKALELSLLDKNLPKIMQKYGEDLLAKQEVQHLQETNNVQPLTDSQRPEDGGVNKAVKDRTGFVLGGTGSSLAQKPLFTNK